jgi:hypothetical protein
MLCVLFGACSKSNLTAADIIGIWKHSEAEIQFSGDGRFVARNIPRFLLFGPSEAEAAVSGQGKWQIVADAAGSDVKLSFNKIDEKDDTFVLPIHTSGSGKSAALFFWKEKEGGERFKFLKEGG